MKTKGSVHGKYPTTKANGDLAPLYSRWVGMKERCMNPRSGGWPWYGARGIKVCDRWLGKGGFDNFVDDMGVPEPGMSLDRINNDGNYEPSNCRWATVNQQAANRRKRQSKPGSLAERAKLAGLSYSLVYRRLKLGWTDERAFSAKPPKPKTHPSMSAALLPTCA